MQNTNSRNSLTRDTDVTAFCTNAQCQIVYEELADLGQQVSDLKETILSLENVIQMKDMQLQNVQRNNERLSNELKKQQRCVRNIKQQLDDERFFYQREKDYFIGEMQRQKTRCVNCPLKWQQKRKDLEEARVSLEEENISLREQLKNKAETTYNLCIKFLRMKYAKDSLRQKFDQLLHEHLQIMEDVMEKLDEARGELNIIVSEKFQEPLPLGKAKFLQVVQRNARLVHENAVLKVQMQRLTLNIEKLKSCAQKPKLINVDAKIITRLAIEGGKKSSKHSIKRSPMQSNENNTAKAVSLTNLLNLESSVDCCRDERLISKIRAHTLKKHSDAKTRRIQTEQTWRLEREGVSSAPSTCQGNCSTIGQTEISTDFRDAATNT